MNDKHTNIELNIKAGLPAFEAWDVKKSPFQQCFMTLLNKGVSYEKGWKI